MKDWRHAWAVWVVATVAAAAACVVLWLVVGQAWCGEEVYDTPPGTPGDTLCRTLVEPVVPWATLAMLPLAFTVFGGLVGIRSRSRQLFMLSIASPFVLVAVVVLATLAVD